jgi:hypothetical protein
MNFQYNARYRIGDIEAKYRADGTKGENYVGVLNAGPQNAAPQNAAPQNAGPQNAVAPIVNANVRAFSPVDIFNSLNRTEYRRDLSRLKAATINSNPSVVRSTLRGIGRGISSVAGGVLGFGVGLTSKTLSLTKLATVAVAIGGVALALSGGGLPVAAVSFLSTYGTALLPSAALSFATTGGTLPLVAISVVSGTVALSIQLLQFSYNSFKNAIGNDILASAISSRLLIIGNAQEMFANLNNADLEELRGLGKFIDSLERSVTKLEKEEDSSSTLPWSDRRKEHATKRKECWQDRVFIREAREKILERMEAINKAGAGNNRAGAGNNGAGAVVSSREYNGMVKKLGQAADAELASFEKLRK